MQKELNVPKLCEDRGRFFVWLDATHRHYFTLEGKTKAERKAEAKRAHRRYCAKLILEDPIAPSEKNGRNLPVVGYSPPPAASVGNMLVSELCAEFGKERRGKISQTQQDNAHRVIAVLVDLYGDTDAAAFDINCLRAVRNEFIHKGYVRKKVNWRVKIVQFIFRWGASYKIVPASVHQELKTLIPIKKGEYNLPESKERQTVSLDDIEKTLAELSPVVRAMVETHLANAARPTEICEIRIENIDRQSEDLWAVTLDHHKTDHLENAETKTLYLAKSEIDMVLPLIGERTKGYIFRPIDAIACDKERRAKGAVFTKKQPSRATRDAKRAKNPKREVGECYDFSAYRTAVYRACDRAGVKRWFPYQLRHTGITRIGLEHGVEAAQHTAGHKDGRTTARYFHGKNEIAKRVALSRNKPAVVKSTVEEIKPVPSAKSKSKDAVIAELLKQNQQLLVMLLQKDETTDLTKP